MPPQHSAAGLAGRGQAACLLLLLVVLLGATLPAAAQDGTLVRVYPPSGCFQAGDTFAVQVRIEDVTDLYGLDIRLAFDPDLLQVVEAQVLPATELLSPPWFIAYNLVDNQAGTIMYVVALLSPHPPVSGSGAIFSFHFEAVQDGTAAVEIPEQWLSDINGDLIPAATAGAVYQIGAGGGYFSFLPLVSR
jgi:hypothetical protein